MSSEPSSTAARNRFLLTSLGVMLIFVLTLIVLVAAYPLVLAPPPTITPTITLTGTITPVPSLSPTITLSPTATRTLRPTFTSTTTLTPSLTPEPSQTPTPPGPPTLTPARPIIGADLYSLLPWSQEDASRVIALINDYPNTLPRQARGENDANYYSAFSFPIIALNEALIRFPDAPQADQWRWDLALDLARSGDQSAGQHYADLITSALNRDETRLEDLPGWFAGHQPQLVLEVSTVAPLPGYLNSYLIRIGGAGSTVILLLETPGAFVGYPLVSDFDFANPVESTAFASDLTGDGIDEAIIFRLKPSNDLHLQPPLVYDLASLPPTQLPFNALNASFPLQIEFLNGWSAVEQPGGAYMLQFESDLLPSCPVHVTRKYRWNGERFDAQPPEFALDVLPGNLAYCDPLIDHAFYIWGAETAMQLIETLLPDWPPEKDTDGKPYPDDARDEWLYRLGVYSALVGDGEKSIETLTGLVEHPSSSRSRWIEPAKLFLESYKSQSGVYLACVESALCDPRQALITLVELIPPSESASVLPTLWEAGVSQRASGYYDFDGDGSTEIWFTVRHRPTEKLEFWILAPYPEGIKAIFVDAVDTDAPVFVPYLEDEIPPRLILEGKITFQINRLPETLEPFILYPDLPQFYPNRFEEPLQAAIDDLFQGKDPEEIYRRLLDLQESPGLLCVASWSCDRYYYILGLTAELAGEESAAVEHYLSIWWDYSKSPFTTMVRLRLKGPSVLPSATPLPTGTGTATPLFTLTPTVTGTPPTATLSPTTTLSPTPYPAP